MFPKKQKDARNACQVAAEIDSCNGGMTSSLRWLAYGPRVRVLKCDSYVINGNLYQTKERDDEKICQNSGVSLLANTMLVCSAKDKNPVLENVTFYGVIEEIWELDYHQFQVPLFKCAWVSNDKGIQYNDECDFTLVNLNKRGHQKDEFVLASQVRQVFYIADPLNKGWSIVLPVPNRYYEGEEDLWTRIPKARPIDNVDIHWKRKMRPKKQRKIAKYDEPRVVEDTELHQDADGLAAAELRGETEIEEPSITGQKKTRGPTSMCILIAAARWGKKSTIEYDDMGRPVYNENGKALQSFIGSVVRSMVPINIKSWPTVPENMKQKVWEEISNVFDLAPQSEAAVMSSAGQKWRDFKNKLNSRFVWPYRDNPEKLRSPPEQYQIPSAIWKAFVDERLHPSWNERTSHCKYHHKMSRKGYIGLETELRQRKIFREDEEVDRSLLWRKAREDKSGNITNTETAEVAEKIDDLLDKKKRGEFISSGSNDVLTTALGSQEHYGRVRGVGGFVKPQVYFKTPRKKRELVSKALVENFKEQAEETKSLKAEVEKLKALLA
ncbi:uncharacterized protein LOC122029117 [Zingiber officinale]|uniref:uncharacterized protein LOC122029117 n=1 Tax=Zingiber officinale TaxID=94328 RepID=UPI001C4BC039|nr:uncharacterized protein LOC122029117 [Zingiber officinale]